MRKTVDRALVRRMIREIQTLRGWSSKRFDGSDIPGAAFGAGLDIDCPWQLKAQDYCFEISCCNGFLVLVVDTYECSGRGTQAGDAWDVDQWEVEKFILSVTASRIGFHTLSRIGRALVAGRNVEFGNGLVVPGICKVGADRALIQVAIRGGSDE